MNKQELIKKIIKKKEFSELLKKDIEMAFEKFDKNKYLDEEKIKFTRNLLRKVFSAFTSTKLLSLKKRSSQWVLRKHLSTRERMLYYEEIYKRVLKELNKEISVIDLGAGVNGFSYKYFEKTGHNVNYVAVEAVGQFVGLMNYYFEKNKIQGRAVHLSLFESEKIKKLIKKQKKPRVVFLFKTIDSLEMLKRDYSKKLIFEIIGLVDRVVVSFATKSMIKKTRFRARRTWILDFIKENFNILDNFELGGEKYIVFCKKM